MNQTIQKLSAVVDVKATAKLTGEETGDDLSVRFDLNFKRYSQVATVQWPITRALKLPTDPAYWEVEIQPGDDKIVPIAINMYGTWLPLTII